VAIKLVVAQQASNLVVASEPIRSPDQKATGFTEAFKPMHNGPLSAKSADHLLT
jgi:hypothetical protein